MPDTVAFGDKQLVLNGMGLREATMLKVDVYVAGLYVEQVSSDPAAILGSDQVKRLVLRFKRDVSRDDITEAWSTGFQRNARVNLASIKPQIDRLNAWMPRFREGDTLTFTWVPGEGVYVAVNQDVKGVIKGDAFGRSMLAIWLGPRPPNSELKKGLLGNHRAPAIGRAPTTPR